ncbi:MAG: methionyl-tRNA formyltransferase [Hyphomicrobiaceae bacterium]|nr:methionyl-tRNA formyltransferase [Hyphomicrobiaceae bacterium]
MRIVFMGTPDFSVPVLAELIAAGHDVAAVYSQPPRPAGRGMELRPSPVHAFAEQSRIPVATPKTLRDPAEQQRFAALSADAAVVVAYGLLLPRPVLDAPRHGCLNIHASALPRWRGAAPIQRAIMAGDRETAVMIMRMEEGLDTGPVCLAERVPIGPMTTAGELHDTLSRIGASLMVRALAALERGTLSSTPQSEVGVCYAAKIDKAEARIDFTRPAHAVHDHIRGLSPFPGAFFEVGPEGSVERVKALASEPVAAARAGAAGEVLDDQLTVACGEGAVRLLTIQRAGRKPAAAAEVLRGFAITPGTRLR